MTATFTSLKRIDTKLQAAAVPTLTKWWRPQLRRFYSHPTARRFAGRVGRGGVKSHTAVKVALNETLAGTWSVPHGEVHYFAFVSQSKPEAYQRLRQLEAWLTALKVPHDRRGDAIELKTLPLGFRVFACAVGAVSGFRCIGFVADEVAKWRNADGANPASEVIASLRAQTVTHPNAVEWFISSPLSMVDFHYELVEAGEDEHQVVGIAPTWVANPSISEAETRRREPDERIWAREYGARPQSAALALLRPEWIDAAFELGAAA